MGEVIDTSDTGVSENGMRIRGAALVHISNLSTESDSLLWMDSANCDGVSPDLFFPEHGADSTAAKGVCQSCVVRDECLTFAVDNNFNTGIWGGLDAAERLEPSRR